MAIHFVTDRILSVYNVEDVEKLIKLANEFNCENTVFISCQGIQFFFRTAQNAENFSMQL